MFITVRYSKIIAKKQMYFFGEIMNLKCDYVNSQDGRIVQFLVKRESPGQK